MTFRRWAGLHRPIIPETTPPYSNANERNGLEIGPMSEHNVHDHPLLLNLMKSPRPPSVERRMDFNNGTDLPQLVT